MVYLVVKALDREILGLNPDTIYRMDINDEITIKKKNRKNDSRNQNNIK
jgi:hypothetical protein